jgi:polysaccharide pyruvyl transferase WcaK-like protein
MKPAVLEYPLSDNLGDYIQSIAAKRLVSEPAKGIDREALHTYTGEPVCLIMNGWFMENADNWPPATNIKPLFVSFHINPTVAKKMTSPQSIAYFKQHQPIGCRDLFTQQLLEEKGVEAYFSGCLTLTLNRNDFIKKEEKPEGILVLSVLERLQPSLTSWQQSKSFFAWIVERIKRPLKAWQYKKARSRLDAFLANQKEPLTKGTQIIENPHCSSEEKEALALNQLEAIARARYVVTSRIHTALPAVAMGIPVLFIEDGLTHINQKSRLLGMESFFQRVQTKSLAELSEDFWIKPNLKKPFIEALKKAVSRQFE